VISMNVRLRVVCVTCDILCFFGKQRVLSFLKDCLKIFFTFVNLIVIIFMI